MYANKNTKLREMLAKGFKVDAPQNMRLPASPVLPYSISSVSACTVFEISHWNSPVVGSG